MIELEQYVHVPASLDTLPSVLPDDLFSTPRNDHTCSGTLPLPLDIDLCDPKKNQKIKPLSTVTRTNFPHIISAHIQF